MRAVTTTRALGRACEVRGCHAGSAVRIRRDLGPAGADSWLVCAAHQEEALVALGGQPQVTTPPPVAAPTPTPRLCIVLGCGRVVDARGLCRAHYSRASRAGRLEEVALPPQNRGGGSRKKETVVDTATETDCTSERVGGGQ